MLFLAHNHRSKLTNLILPGPCGESLSVCMCITQNNRICMQGTTGLQMYASILLCKKCAFFMILINVSVFVVTVILQLIIPMLKHVSSLQCLYFHKECAG